jgi:hypothetical protein
MRLFATRSVSSVALYRSLVVLAVCPLLVACEPAALAVLGGGAGTILRYNLDGIAARGGSLFYDNATAVELVQQTEKVLAAGLSAQPAPTPAAAGASLAPRSF